MLRLTNDPTAFAAEAARGFALAHRELIVPIDGGVARAQEAPLPTVSVVIGGGSGHYPAFGGLVGAGLASGAALGNIFASPSSRQVADVVRATERGNGALLIYGNYAGDVLNFDEASERLTADGLSVRSLAVTDDIASGPTDEPHQRRGVAGDLVVIKIAGAAAWRGDDLETVHDLARRANDRTRTFGVAFSGCTLPGASEPLFNVEPGTVALGMGIHGEPGVADAPWLTARQLAHLLVGKLVAEGPADAGRQVVAVLNGLGATKHEELFVLWADVHDRLGVELVDLASVEVGEFVTSFDMSGVSLTLSWLDDELLELWRAPASSPAFRVGSVGDTATRTTEQPRSRSERSETQVQGAPDGRTVRLREAADVVDERIAGIELHLGELDAITGDGDHGIGMRRGSRAAARAAARAAERGAPFGRAVAEVADAWQDEAGGTSGALWGAGLRALAERLPNDGAPTAGQWAGAIERAVQAVRERGGADVGDKTMVDALVPFSEVFTREAGLGARAALASAARAATDAAAATEKLVARRGRASTHGFRSLGHPDPGAVSFAAVVASVDVWLENQK